jgi:uncharacterized membrane protein YfcA
LTGIFEYFALMLLVSIFAGVVGAMVGIGGGIVVVPALTLLFGVPLQYAIGASIVSIIATSSGSATTYVRDKITNLRIGMFLEVGSTAGAVIGAVSSIALIRSGYAWALFLAFGLLFLFSAYTSVSKHRDDSNRGVEVVNQNPNALATRLNLRGSYFDAATDTTTSYVADKVLAGFAVMVVAGIVSALLGVGGGVLKVLGMDKFMKLPFKVSTTTSNFMIGVTAAAGTGIYYVAGFVNPFIAAPVAVGIVIGAVMGTKILVRTKPGPLRLVFAAVLVVLALEMIRQGLS